MMRNKILAIIFLSGFFATNAYACLCIGFIQASFQATGGIITASLTAQSTALKTLKSSINSLKNEIKDQNEDLEKDNNVMKDEILNDMALIFYLKQKNNLR